MFPDLHAEQIMIAALGECMIEISERGGVLRPGYGGDTLNTLIYLARLLPQRKGSLHYISGLGKDPFSDQMVKSWSQEGINTALVRRIGGRLPGLYYIRTDAGGERRFDYWRGQSAARCILSSEFSNKLIRRLEGCELFYCSGISLGILPGAGRRRLIELVAALKGRGTRIVFDSNYRAPLWKSEAEARTFVQQIHAVSDIALVTFGDERQLFGDLDPGQTCRRLANLGVVEIVVKNGVEPCTVNIDGEREIHPLLIKVKPVDTTAAGDAFNAAYLAARLQHLSTRASVTAGNHLASLVVQFPGALMPMEKTPLLEDLV
ncbi:MAG: sugar kinase [Gammaproteobacteria bacterium]